MKKLVALSFTFLLSTCNIVLAGEIKYNVGLSYFHANINNSKFDYVDKYETITSPKDQLKSISVGISKFYDNNFNWSLNTNRLYNQEIKRTVKRKSDGLLFQNETKTTIDSLIVAYRVKRFNPGLLLKNVKISKFLYYQGSSAGYENKHAILGGLNLAYLATKNLIPSVSYILPNKELDLEGAISLNINCLF